MAGASPFETQSGCCSAAHVHAGAVSSNGSVPEGTIYICPMHPQVRQVGPGFCPICGMALEPELASAEANSGSSRSEEHTSELQSHLNLVCRLLLEKKKKDVYVYQDMLSHYH